VFGIHSDNKVYGIDLHFNSIQEVESVIQDDPTIVHSGDNRGNCCIALDDKHTPIQKIADEGP
jgi:hypothetical protein